MGLKISNTTVITNSRNLINIEAVSGNVVATDAEVSAGTANNKVITPATLKTALGSMSGSNFPSWDSMPSTFDPTLTFDEYGRGTARLICETGGTTAFSCNKTDYWDVLAPNPDTSYSSNPSAVTYYGPEVGSSTANVKQYNLARSTYYTNSNRGQGGISTSISAKPLAYYFNNVALELIGSGAPSSVYCPRGYIDIYLNNATIELPSSWANNASNIQIRVWGVGALYGTRMSQYSLLVKGNSQQRIYDR